MLPSFVPYDPPPSQTSVVDICDGSTLARLTEPPNAPAPNVDVPVPRWTWMLSSECARSGKSTKYVDMSSESASGTPSRVKFNRDELMPRSCTYEYPDPPTPPSA